MKRALVVVALLGAMLVVDWLKLSGSLHTTSLAGIGFVMLAAYAVAELGSAISLPLVTGYIVAGVALGPSVGGIISGEMIGDMRMFNTLALGLIATSAGLELDVRQIARLVKTLVVTTLIKVVVGVSLVALAVFAVEASLGLLGLDGSGELRTLALVLGVLSIGTSPSISLAVLSETRAKGRLSELVLGAAVFKDLVVVVALAMSIAIGRAWLAPGAALDAGVLLDVGRELGGSIAAGAIVGLIFILYVRFVRAEMLLFVAAMILVVAELCRAFHLELLLVFIAAGFVVRNFSEYEHEMMGPLRLVALPVFVLFFANAGASVDLLTTWTILPLALAACAARTLTYILASRLGGKWAGESPAIQRHAWLAYLPQAGVTLGLVGVAALQLPQLAGPITTTGMAIVAVNLLLGPVTLRRALNLLGEIPGATPAEPKTAERRLRKRLSSGVPAPDESRALLPADLQRVHSELAGALSELLARFDAEVRPTLPALPEPGAVVPDPEAFRVVVAAHRASHRQLYVDLLGVLSALPTLALREEEAAGGGWWRRRKQRLPLRRIARIALGPALAGHVARRFEAGLGARAAEAPPPVQPAEGSAPLPPLPPELQHGFQRFAGLLLEAGTRRLRPNRLRYSDVAPEEARAVQHLIGTSEAELVRLAQAAWGTRLLEHERASVTRAMREAVHQCLISPALDAAAKVQPAARDLQAWLAQQRLDLRAHRAALDIAGVRGEFEALARSVLAELSREFRFAATVRATMAALAGSAASVPERIECLLQPAQGGPLAQGKIQSVPLHAQADALVRRVLPAIDHAARSVATALNQLPRRIEDVVQSEWPLLEARVDSSAARELEGLVRGCLERLDQCIEEVTATTVGTVEAAVAALHQTLEATYTSFSADVLPGPVRQRQREAKLHALLGRSRSLRLELSSYLRSRWLGARPLGDAAELREAIVGESRQLPEALERWFDSSPVSDVRVFAGHRRLMDIILDTESSRLSLGRASVLITGTKGSGKSSLLNICELELPYALQLRLHAADFGRDVGLLEAMGALLDCPAAPAALSRQLQLRGPAVFVDDLPSWIYASQQRAAELERVLSLIASTSSRAFWVVSADNSLLQLLGELAPMKEVFTHVLSLPPLSLAEVKHLVTSRIELSGVDVQLPSSGWERLLDRLRSADESDRIHRRLWRMSEGNPGRIISSCRRALQVDGREIKLALDTLRSQERPSFDLSPVQLAVLAMLHRYGPQSCERLALEVAVPAMQLSRSLTFLMAAGLVHTVDEGHAFAVAPAADWAVFEALLGARLATS